MKTVTSLFFLFSFMISMSAQEATKTVTKKRIVRKKVQQMRSNIGYNKITGERISEEEFSAFIKNYPGNDLEREFDKYGVLRKIYINPEDPYYFLEKKDEFQYKVGDVLPPFMLKPTNGDILDSENMNGEYVLLNFETSTDWTFNKKRIQQIEEIVSKSKIKVKNILLCSDVMNREDINSFTEKFDAHLVPGAQNFIHKYRIFMFPTTLLINDKGEILAKVGMEGVEELRKFLD